MTEKEKIFKTWTLIETLVILATIATNVMYVFLRTMLRFCRLKDRIEKDLPEFETRNDPNQDFLNCESRQLLINVLTQSLAPILVYYTISLFFYDEVLPDNG